MLGIKRQVYMLWQTFSKGTYNERSELIAVYRKKAAEAAKDIYDRVYQMPDRKYEVNAWSLN